MGPKETIEYIKSPFYYKEMNYNNNNINASDEIDWTILTTFFKNKYKRISIHATIVGFLFALLSYTQPVLYKSKISLFRVHEMSSIQSAGFSLSSIMNQSDGVDVQLKLELVDIIKSERILNEISTKKWDSIDSSLIDLWEINKEPEPLFPFMSLSLNENKYIKENHLRKSRKMLKQRINVDEDLRTGLVSIEIEMENRELSVEILKFIKEFVVNFTITNLKEISAKEILYLSQRIDSIKGELDNAQSDLISFLEQNKNFQNSPELTIAYEDLNREVRFFEAGITVLLQQMEVAKLNQIKISPVLASLDDPLISDKKSSPGRKSWLFTGLFLGTIFSTLILFFRDYKKSR